MNISFMNAYRNLTLKALKGCTHELQNKSSTKADKEKEAKIVETPKEKERSTK